MRQGFVSTAVRPYIAGSAVAILTLGLWTASPVTNVAIPRTELHSVQLVAAAAAEVGTVAPPTTASSDRPAAAGQTAADTTSPPDFLAFAASILDYLNSLGLGAGPGLLAIGLSGLVVTFAATAYAWNGFANLVNPVLRALGVPKVPKFPVCFAGQSCASPASAQARSATSGQTTVSAASGLVNAARPGVATSKRVVVGTANPTMPVRTARTIATPAVAAAVGTNGKNDTATKVRGTTKSTSSGTGGSKRVRNAAAH